MEQTPRQIDISKTFSHALRHEPYKYHIELDEFGFVDVNVFLDALHKYGSKKCKTLTMEELELIVTTCPKGRYEITDGKIKAQGGHGKGIGHKIIKIKCIPPDILYHGTSPTSAIDIMADGLKGMERQCANLSADTETAFIVGKRKCKEPFIFIVDAKKAYEDKVVFYLEANGIYSVDYLPSIYMKDIRKNS